MKKNLNEEISRIKDMMKKMVNEDFNVNNDEMMWNELGDFIDNPNNRTEVSIQEENEVDIYVQDNIRSGEGKLVHVKARTEEGMLDKIIEGGFYKIVKNKYNLAIESQTPLLEFNDQEYRDWFGNMPQKWYRMVREEFNELEQEHRHDYDDYDQNDFDDNMSYRDRMYQDRSDYARGREDWDDEQRAEYRAGA
jgi:hypothetical protein